ncbi:hypothetical protein AaE_001053 [Aphanomyces astaci]|uniref:Uncharacterized protein n=1 Tax=Aphanomyces astaci TaxID=112090 RepID=A0A6A5B2W3_APHAT|nr:hypothetical protein AaE_001053 [Aphanomyces astaci]
MVSTDSQSQTRMVVVMAIRSADWFVKLPLKSKIGLPVAYCSICNGHIMTSPSFLDAALNAFMRVPQVAMNGTRVPHDMVHRHATSSSKYPTALWMRQVPVPQYPTLSPLRTSTL